MKSLAKQCENKRQRLDHFKEHGKAYLLSKIKIKRSTELYFEDYCLNKQSYNTWPLFCFIL